MKKPSTVKELCEFIWYLEDKYNLPDFEIEKVKPWQAYRVEIYFKLGILSGLFEKELRRGSTKLEKFLSLKSLFLNSIKSNPFWNIKKVDFLLFPHARSKMVDNQYIDIYSHYFVQEQLKLKRQFIEYEEQYNGQHIRSYESYKKYLDYMTLVRNIKSKFIKISLSDTQKNIIENVEKEILEVIGKRYNIKDVLIQRTKKFLVTYDVYKKILELTQPKEIYLVVGYGKVELIKAAKELGIKTIEFQHGTFSKYHLGYSYPNKEYVDYFPDEFLVWNEYWQNLIDLPIMKENIKIYPFKYLKYEKIKYNMKKFKRQMVVLCQAGITDAIAEKIVDNIEFFEQYSLIFKLHPSEYGRSHMYKNLSQLKKIQQLKIVENVDLYKLLSESEYQAGVFSTALYEGIEFDCKTILFNLSGIEYMDKFIEMYNVKVI